MFNIPTGMTVVHIVPSSITVNSPLDSSLINIRVTDPDPRTASDVANSTAESLAFASAMFICMDVPF